MTTKRVRPVLVESKEYSIIHKFGDCLDTHVELQKWYGDARPIYQELILISLEDERIEVGDEFYCSDRTNYTHLFTCSGHTDNTHLQVKSDNEYGYGDWAICYSKKVIARQSQIPQEYISKFIEQYNNDCVLDLEIEMENKIAIDGHTVIGIEPKITNGFVTIVEKEPITYTEEEVKFLCSGAYSLGFSSLKSEIPDLEEMMELDNWFNKNKKK